MLVSFALGDANFSRFYPTRDLKVAFYPTRNPNASQWNIGCKIFALGMYISCFLCRFHLRRAPNANQFLGGIWALGVINMGTTILTLQKLRIAIQCSICLGFRK